MANLGAVLSNAQISLTADVSGTLPVANGGTGATTSTGTGAGVHATAPTLTDAVMDGSLNLASGSVTIATGAIAAAKPFHSVDTEAAAASDDLDSITGGVAGDFLVLRAANAARTVVVRHIGGGTGNIRLAGAANFSLQDVEDTLVLIFDGTNWLEVSRQSLVPSAAYSPSNVTTDRTYDANATTIDEIADVLGTLITDLQARGLVE